MVLSQGGLPQEFFSDSWLRKILCEVQGNCAEEVTQITLRAYIPLQRYEIGNFCCGSADPFTNSHFPSVYSRLSKTTIVSLWNWNSTSTDTRWEWKADSYSQVQFEKPYIAVGTEYYIDLRMTEMIMCRSIRFIYYYEELIVVKHKSAYGCISAIFYDMAQKRVTESCEFKYMCDIWGIFRDIICISYACAFWCAASARAHVCLHCHNVMPWYDAAWEYQWHHPMMYSWHHGLRHDVMV